MAVTFLDIETYSDLDLKEVGSFIYAQSCELMLVGWAVDDGPPSVWDLTTGQDMPDDLRNALQAPAPVYVGHNASGFERWVLAHTLPDFDWSLENWVDTMILCATNGLPRALGKACEAVKMSSEYTKLTTSGHALINRFCKPAPSNHKVGRYTSAEKPEEWDDFIEYCRRDVLSMRELYRTLPNGNYRVEVNNWHANLRMNDRGLPMDIELARLFIDQVNRAEAELSAELPALTGGNIKTHSQNVAIVDWARSQGYHLSDLTAASVEAALTAGDAPGNVHRVLEIRQILAKSSVKKYDKVMSATASDGRLHGAFEFYGAGRTGREAGRLFQPQNLPRPAPEYSDPELVDMIIENLKGGQELLTANAHKVAASCVRAVLCAPDGYELVVSDLANIEGRMLAWLAGEQWKLNAFSEYDKGTGPDLYKLAFAKAFYLDVDEVAKSQRTIGKVMELACGYQGAIGAFKQMATAYEVDLPDDRILDIVQGWRIAHPRIVELWWSAETACLAAMEEPGKPFWIGPRLVVAYRADLNHLAIRLPSGRQLIYPSPMIYEGRGRKTLKFKTLVNYNWVDDDTYGGKLVENCIAEDTDVLTDRGWVAIQNVQPDDWVHDGVEFVNHGGLLFKSTQACVTVDGVYMTPDHEVLTNEGWQAASQLPRPYRPNIRQSDCPQETLQRREKVALGVCLQVWEHLLQGGLRSIESGETRRDSKLWMPHQGTTGQAKNTRHEWTPGVCGMAQYVRQVQTAYTPSVAQLRSAWHHGVQVVAGFLRKLLGGHGPQLPAGAYAGAYGQRAEIFGVELRVADPQASGQQSQGQHLHPNPKGGHDRGTGQPGVWGRVHNYTVSDRARLGGGRPVDQTEREKQVYDIRDCGSRQRFVVRGDSGPFIVHNCTQAAARDILFHGVQRCESAGMSPIGTVHDEIICLEEIGSYSHEQLSSYMINKPDWASGLPLAAEGYNAKRYRKD